MRTVALVLLVIAIAISFAGCATWDSMTPHQKNTVIGAGVGGVIGAAVSEGAVLSTVGGAAIGGVIGDQLYRRHRHRR